MLNFLLFVCTYSGGFMMALFSSPVWAFMLYQLVYFFDPVHRWWSYLIPELSYSLFTVVLMLFVLIKSFKTSRNNNPLASPQFKWAYGIGILYLFSMAYAIFPSANQVGVTNFIKLLIIISMAYMLIDSSKKLDGVLYAYIAGASYIGFQAFQNGRNASGRVEGIGTVDSPDSNGIAAAIVPTLALSLYYFWFSQRKLVKFIILIAGVIILNGIVLINSRASFLAALTSLSYFIFMLLFSKFQRPNQRKSVVVLILFGILGLSFVLDESALSRFSSISQEKGIGVEEETGWSRVYYWIAAVDMAKDHPFGAGVKGFEYYAPDYIPEHINTGGSRNRSVHSSWFEALSEVGYLGLLFLIMMIFSSYRSTRHSRRVLYEQRDYENFFKVVAIEAALIGYVVSMSFMNRYRAENLYWCVLFTACAYNIFFIKNTNKNENQMSDKAATKKTN